MDYEYFIYFGIIYKVLEEDKNEGNQEIIETCPKCNCNDVVFQGNWSGVMVSDLYAEHFWICKCKSCGFTFPPLTQNNKPDPINFKRDYA